jgi:5-methyltetrahydrofolate--homocysteine methyltransferase
MALADRLAEGVAERMYQRVRAEFWGYAADEAFTSQDLIAEAERWLAPVLNDDPLAAVRTAAE